MSGINIFVSLNPKDSGNYSAIYNGISVCMLTYAHIGMHIKKFRYAYAYQNSCICISMQLLDVFSLLMKYEFFNNILCSVEHVTLLHIFFLSLNL